MYIRKLYRYITSNITKLTSIILVNNVSSQYYNINICIR